MRKILKYIAVLAAIGVAGGLFLSRPALLPAALFDGLTGDPLRGQTVFRAAGCASCHKPPDGSGDADLLLSGGYRIDSPFGTFVAPNISPSDQGIGGWTAYDLGNALLAGVSPEGRHYYPSLPYTTYARMQPQDVVDLKSFLDTLPPSATENQPHALGFPFTIRRGLGLWKRLNLTSDWYLNDATSEPLVRGRYLVEALGHCTECHTPRNALGGLDKTRWLQGAPNPSGKGRIPGIAPQQLDWSAQDIAYYLETGFTPDYDSAGGEMTAVIENMAHLTPQDRAAIAAYLKALP